MVRGKIDKVKDNIKYIRGDATRPVGEGTKIIAHCCNDIGAWGAGFVMAISRRWPEPKKEYKRFVKHGCGLGDVLYVKCEEDIWVANIIGQKGIHKRGNQVPIRYGAIRKGFISLKKHALKRNATVHIPDMIGCGLAGGSRQEMIKIINEELEGIDVYVYKI